MDVAILGAGIGGLAVALALRQRGQSPRLYERAAAITEVGAGIQISPNGAAVLQALGLGAALDRTGLQAREVRLINGETGRTVARLPMDQRRYHFLHRADLIDLLWQAVQAQGIPVTLGCEAVRVGFDSDHRPVLHSTDQSHSADVLICADGAYSTGRAFLDRAAHQSGGPAAPEPVFSGQVAWRATLATDTKEPPEVQVHMGAGRHLVRYPLRGGRLINLVGVEERTDWAADGWHHEADPATFAEAFSQFPAVQDDLARLDQAHLWGLHLRSVAQHWQKDGLILLGDAAHPTLPFLAQGANMALEDAWVLAECLSDGSGPARYETLRKPRTTRITAAAQANARNYHLAPGPKRLAAHAALRLASTLSPSLLTARFNWLYDHDVTRP